MLFRSQQTGVGDYFVASLRSDIESLRLTAGVYRVVYRDYHRSLSRVFPYGIYYTRTDEEVVVWAVIDLRRDPDWIRTRLKP